MRTRSTATGTRRVPVAGAVLSMAFVLLGCTSTQSRAPAPAPPVPATPGAAAAVLDQRWYVDRNDNTIPDFVERETGRDPDAGGCGSVRCALPRGTSLPELLDGQNTLVVLDGSGSMAGTAGDGVSRMAAAKQAIDGYVTNTPRAVDRIGLEAYGHRGNNSAAGKAVSCRGAEVIRPIGALDAGNVAGALARFQPTGWTPIARALRTATEAFRGKEGQRNRIILVSDGIETCAGDPVAAARELRSAGIGVTTDVVGFDVGPQADKQRLREIARAAGGEYLDASTAQRLREYFDRLVQQRRQLADACLCLRNEYRDVLLCLRNSYNDALLKMRNLAVDASRSGHPDQATEIQRIAGAVLAGAKRQQNASTAAATQTLAKVQGQAEAINRRLAKGGG